MSLYNSFVMSHFNYCNVVWHFCGMENTIKLEKLQKRALRVIFNDYKADYETLLQRSKCPLLYVSRLRCIAVETFKNVHKLNPEFLHDMVDIKETEHDLRGGVLLNQPRVNTVTFGLQSIRYEGARIWNLLPKDMKNTDSLDVFKARLKSWNGFTCKCGYCPLCKLPYI